MKDRPRNIVRKRPEEDSWDPAEQYALLIIIASRQQALPCYNGRESFHAFLESLLCVNFVLIASSGVRILTKVCSQISLIYLKRLYSFQVSLEEANGLAEW